MRHFLLAAAALAAAIAAAPAAFAQANEQYIPAERQQWRVTPFAGNPTYSVHAVSIIANDETGADWAGSDEIRVKFFAYNDRVDTFADGPTQTFGDFDTGERFAFTYTGGASCIQPLRRDCETGAGAMTRPSFRVRVEELDSGWWNDNDLLGEAFVDYSPTVLAQHMPNVNDVWEDSRRIGGYTVYFQFKRWS